MSCLFARENVELLCSIDHRQVNDNPVSEGIWQTITEGMYAEYCQSDSNTLMFADQLNDKMAVTKDLLLSSGDIIQFRVRENNSKCTNILAIKRRFFH